MKFKEKKANTDDKTLLEKIHDRIKWDIRVSNSDISMKVKNGCVTLFGYFDKAYRRTAAIKAISSTTGVTMVEDQTQVLSDYHRTDKVLESLINNRILTLPFLPDEWISVEVSDGVVKLEGRVFRSRFKAFASRATWELSGVKDCFNLIEISDPTKDVRSSRRPAHTIRPRFNSSPSLA